MRLFKSALDSTILPLLRRKSFDEVSTSMTCGYSASCNGCSAWKEGMFLYEAVSELYSKESCLLAALDATWDAWLLILPSCILRGFVAIFRAFLCSGMFD